MKHEQLPEEDFDSGLYIHEPDRERLVTITHYDRRNEVDVDKHYVGVTRFMEMQRSRDNFRKAAALVNAILVREAGVGITLDVAKQMEEVLDRAGLSGKDGEAMLSIIEGVKAEARQ